MKYNLPEKKLLDPYKYFSYLCSLVQEKDFKIYIGLLRARKYHDLVARLLIFLEKRYPEYLDKCIECMLDVKMIAYHNALIGKHEYTLATSNIRERMIVCASFYFNRKKYIRAEKLYGQLYNVDNHSDEIAVNFARTLYRLDKIDHAIDLLLEHMEFNGSTPLCLGYVGIFLFCKKMYPDCRKFLSRALHDEENGLFRIFYARSLREEGTISAAAAYLKRHAADHSVSGEYMAHLGAYLVMSGMEEEGLAYLEDAKKRKGCPGWVNGRIKQAHEALKREGE